MLDVAVTEVSLQRAGVDALVGQLIPAGVPQHVGMDREFELGSDPQPSHQLARSEVNTNGDAGSCSRLSRRRAPQLPARDRMHRRRAILGAVHMQPTVTIAVSSLPSPQKYTQHLLSGTPAFHDHAQVVP